MHSCSRSLKAYINLHLSVEAIVEQEVVSHADPVGLHGMTLTVVVIPNITWNKIKHHSHFTCMHTQTDDLGIKQ